jgi:hypothetical protein
MNEDYTHSQYTYPQQGILPKMLQRLYAKRKHPTSLFRKTVKIKVLSTSKKINTY